MKSLLDPTFRYTPAAATDIRKTFARIAREQKAESDRRKANEAEAQRVVEPIRRKP